MPGARMSLLFRPKRPRLRLSHGVLSLSHDVLSGRPSRRSYADGHGPEGPPPYDHLESRANTFAVLGGGLTGLVTAYRLARLHPKAKITLYEASSRLGGWVDTEEVKDPQGRTILFERGARMVQVPRQGSSKFDDVPFYHLIEELKLENEVVGIAKGTPYAPYIYYPDHLVQMPTPGPKTTYMGWLKMLQSLRTEPIFRNMASWLMHAVNRRLDVPFPPEALAGFRANPAAYFVFGEVKPRLSLGAAYARLLGDREPVDNILSAMIHGIWGGDVWKLTAKRDPFGVSARPRPPPGIEDWAMVDRGSVDAALFLRTPDEDYVLGREWAGFSHMWFRDGFQTLTRALVAALEKCPNVTIKTETPVSDLRLTAQKNSIYVKDDKKANIYDRVVSTLYAGTLASLTHGKLPSLDKFPAVTIQAVNLWYPTQKLNHPRAGAGYLIPQTVPHALNPEKALGVLFDSDRDLLRFRRDAEGPPPNLGTTFTVLLGGHHWNGPDGMPMPADQLPTPKQAGQLAKAVVARHLGISAEHNAQAIVSTKLCRDCIPQHGVDHWERMARARDELDTGFAGRLTVAGPSYQMPGVFGSITAAYDVANYLTGQYPRRNPIWKGLFPVGRTGLGRFVEPDRYVFRRKDELPLRFPAHILGRAKPTLTQRAAAGLRELFTTTLRLMFRFKIMRERLDTEQMLQREADRRRSDRLLKEAELERREAEILTALKVKVAALEAKVRRAEGLYDQHKADIDAMTAWLLKWTEDKARRQAAAIDYLYKWMIDWQEAKSHRLAAEIASRQKWLTHWYESNLARYEARLVWQSERIRALQAWVVDWNQTVADLKETRKQADLLEREILEEQRLRVSHGYNSSRKVLLMAQQRHVEAQKIREHEKEEALREKRRQERKWWQVWKYGMK